MQKKRKGIIKNARSKDTGTRGHKTQNDDKENKEHKQN